MWFSGATWAKLGKKADEQKVSQQLSRPPKTESASVRSKSGQREVWEINRRNETNKKLSKPHFFCLITVNDRGRINQLPDNHWPSQNWKCRRTQIFQLLSWYSGNYLPNHTPVPPSILCQHSPWGFGHTGGTCRDLPSGIQKTIWFELIYHSNILTPVHACSVNKFDIQTVKHKSKRTNWLDSQLLSDCAPTTGRSSVDNQPVTTAPA